LPSPGPAAGARRGRQTQAHKPLMRIGRTRDLALRSTHPRQWPAGSSQLHQRGCQRAGGAGRRGGQADRKPKRHWESEPAPHPTRIGKGLLALLALPAPGPAQAHKPVMRIGRSRDVGRLHCLPTRAHQPAHRGAAPARRLVAGPAVLSSPRPPSQPCVAPR